MMIDEKNKNPTMTANPILLQKKYARVIECFAKQQGLSLDEALGLFYHSEVHQLMRDGVSDMHCMSDLYLEEELRCWKDIFQIYWSKIQLFMEF